VRSRALFAVALLALLVPPAAIAQGAAATRADAWRQLRAEKATRLHAYVPKGAEKFAIRFEDNILPRLAAPRSGIFPFVGRITSGGGFAMGPGFRLLDVAGGEWTSYAAGSLKGYWQIDTRTASGRRATAPIGPTSTCGRAPSASVAACGRGRG
jgi:hypothetical protein